MKKYGFLFLFLLCGCQKDSYSLSEYINDTKALFCVEEIEVYDDLNQPLYAKQLLDILVDLSNEDLDYLFSFDCVTKEMCEENNIISKEIADKMNEYVYNEVYSKQFYETNFDIGEVISVPSDTDLSCLPQGIYEKDGTIYEVDHNGEYKEYELDCFELESTFSPNLSESIVLPEGVSLSPSGTSFFEDRSLIKLKSHYFNFKLKDYKISGSVYPKGVQINVYKKTENGYKIENELTLNNIQCTCDLSLEQKDFYFRVDYDLKDQFKVSKTKTINQNKVDLKSFDLFKNAIKNLKEKLPIVEDELHLLTFKFEVPATQKLVTITMDLSLKLLANGEVDLTFKTSNKQGSQSYKDDLHYLNKQSYEFKPYVEGSIECACDLNFGLNLGKVHLVDVGMRGGIGAEATSTIHYVDKKNKWIGSDKVDVDLDKLAQLFEKYNLDDEKYIEFCSDANIYYFGRILVNQKKSLFKNLGIQGTYTPIKNDISLIHIENKKIVEACTRNEIIDDENIEIDVFDISNYQFYLKVGKSVQITVSKENCTFTSSNPEIVSVNQSGVITALQEGYATIVVEDETGYKRSCLVMVAK